MIQLHKIIAIGFLLLILPSVNAVNLGSNVKNDYAQVFDGQTAKFILLFWTRDEEPVQIEIAPVQVPESFVYLIKPEHISIDKNTGEEYIYLSDINDYAKVKKVEIFIKVPADTEPGMYEAIFKAGTIPSGSGSGFFTAVSQQRMFELKIDVLKSPLFFEKLVDGMRSMTGNFVENVGRFSNAAFSSNFSLLILAVLAVALLIYRYIRKTKSKDDRYDI